MEAAWVESRLWKGRQAACVLEPVRRQEILVLTFPSTGVELHCPWSNFSTAQQLYKVLAGADCEIQKLSVDVPEELFDYVLDDRCMLYAYLEIDLKIRRAREASQVISSGLPSLDQ